MKSKDATCVYRDHPSQSRRQGTFGDTVTHRQKSNPEASSLTPSTASSNPASSHHDPCLHLTAAPTNPTSNPTVDSRSPGGHDRPTESGTAPEQGGVSSTSSSVNTPVSTFTKNSRVETSTRNIAGSFHFHAEHRAANQPQAVIRSATHKTRLLGQSHWINTVGLVSNSVPMKWNE